MEVKNQTQSGVYPSDWSSKPLSLLSSFISKGATPTTYGYNWEKDGVLFLRSECVSENGLDLSQSMFISPEAHKALIRGEVMAGDILMTITGNVGRVVLLDNRFGTANTNQHISRIRIINPDANAGYIYHYLSQSSVRNYYNSITTGQAYPQISLTQVRNTEVPLPPLAEQEAIAETLSDADAFIEAVEQLLAKKRQVKQGAMSELLTGKRRLSGFSGEWEEKVFTDICNLVHGYQFRTTDFIDSPDGIKVIKIGNVLDAYFDTEHCDYIDKKRLIEFSAYLIKQGDILMSLTGNIGRVVRVGTVSEPLLQNYRVGKFVPINVDANFLTYCLASSKTTMQLEYFANQAAQANFGKQDFEKIKLDVPTSIAEQTAIAEILSDMDAEITALEGKLVKARQVKAGMMSELLTGKIRLV